MVSYAAAQRAASEYASRQARAALKGQGAAETGYGTTNTPGHITTASTTVKKATNAAITSSKKRLRRVKLRGGAG